MTRYEQGFLTKCASVRVPKNVAFALLKRAQEAKNDDAGIGGYSANGINWLDTDHVLAPNHNSYAGRLLGNARGAERMDSGRSGIKAPRYSPATNLYYAMPSSDNTNSGPISQRSLDGIRSSQAHQNAASIGYFGVPRDRIINNLIEAGKKNQQSYIDTGTVPKRDTLDRTGIETLQLSPEDEAQLLEMQNTMARNSRRGTNVTA
jgi:hypothetical protein